MVESSPEETIFYAALEINDLQERGRYVDKACGTNQELRAKVSELLSDYDAGGFLERPPIQGLAMTAGYESIGEGPGTVIGNYKLLEQIGEGGMGLVFMAEQSRPIRRRVALKIVKPGLDTKAVISRFDAERQALALMDHPNIARVYDAGSTSSGRPYFVMELVRGKPISEYCERQHLSVKDRLGIFIDVCHAVQHAHQKGVIHRDLKPNNILVSNSDTAPLPKVIDFGVAKATTHSLTENTLFTAFNQIIGTLLYMSPEQADVGNQDIDTRSDVYSLGVVLYELLTGVPPFEAKRLREVSQLEMLRIIQEEDPPKPSQRATTEARAQSTIGTGTQVDRVIKPMTLKGDLDWIVMKALQKDRKQRYESPSALADDLRRYLDGEPVLARSPTLWYLSQKFVRQYSRALVVCGVVLASLIVALLISVGQTARAVIAEQKKELALRQARQAVDDMYSQVAEEWLDSQGTLTDVQRNFLEKALNYYDAFSKELPNDSESKYQSLKALARTAALNAKLGKLSVANEEYLRVIQTADAEIAKNPERLNFWAERFAARVELCRSFRSLDLSNELIKQLDLAMGEFESQSIENFSDTLVRVHWAKSLSKLAPQLVQSGQVQQAERVLIATIAFWEQLLKGSPTSFDYRYELAAANMRLGTSQMWWGTSDGKASATLQKAEEMLSKLLSENPNHKRSRVGMTVVLQNLGVISAWSKRFSEAVELDRRLVKLSEDLAREFPQDIKIQLDYAAALGNLASNQLEKEDVRTDETTSLSLAAHEVLTRLATQFPTHSDCALQYTISLLRLMKELRSAKDHTRLDQIRATADSIVPEIIKLHHSNSGIATRSALYHSMQAALHLENNEYGKAIEYIDTYPYECKKFAIFDDDKYSQLKKVADSERQEHNYNYANLFYTAAELIDDCIAMAQVDDAKTSQEREAVVQKYETLRDSFRLEARKAFEAWISDLLVQGNDIFAFRVVYFGEEMVKSSRNSRANKKQEVPTCLANAYCRVDKLMFEELMKHAEIHLAENANQSGAACMLCSVPREFRNDQLALKFAEQSMLISPEDDVTKLASSWAQFRSGIWEEGLQHHSPIYPQFIRAMALWHLNRHDEARSALNLAQQEFSEYQKKAEERLTREVLTFPSAESFKWLSEEANSLIDSEDSQ